MTFTIGTGPFGDQGDKTFYFEVLAPRDHVLYFEDSPRRVRVLFGDETVADSRRVKFMHEQGHMPVYRERPGAVRLRPSPGRRLLSSHAGEAATDDSPRKVGIRPRCCG